MKVFLLLLMPVILFPSVGLVLPRSAAAEESVLIAVIVNPSNSNADLSSAALSRIYKGRQEKWEDGSDIVVTDRPVRSEIRSAFYEAVLRTEPTKKFFESGSPIPFRAIQIRSDEAVIAFVSRVPGAIGYVEAKNVDGRVKVLAIDGKRIDEVDYLLRISGSKGSEN